MPLAPRTFVPGPLAPLIHRIGGLVGRVPVPVITPPVPMQFIHEEDVGQAFLLCIVGAGPPGVYNITGDGVLSGAQVLRELGLVPIPAPARLLRAAARGVSALPFAPPFAGWAEAFTHPAIMDASKAKKELGWRPRYNSLEALRDTLKSRAPRRWRIVMGTSGRQRQRRDRRAARGGLGGGRGRDVGTGVAGRS